MDALGFQLPYNALKVEEGPSKPVNADYGKRVASSEEREDRLKLRAPIPARPALFLRPNDRASGRPQRLLLDGAILVLGADAGISNQTRHSSSPVPIGL